jgi:F-type H+-transporting ATPase subunit gamma
VAGQRDLRRRIRSIRNTEQITRAMKMVAAARLRRAQENILAARPLAHKMKDVIARLATRTDPERHPLLARRGDRRIELFVVTSDRGLCGSFNANILRRAQAYIAEHRDREVSLHIVGRRARDFFKSRPVTITKAYADVFRNFGVERAREITADLIARYTSADLDAVDVLYNEFKSAIQQNLVVERILPVPRPEPDPGAADLEYLYEPDPDQILGRLLPTYATAMIWAALLESNAAENGARMAAMDAATKNARELIGTLTLKMNRIRQAAITTEIIEVVSGADALG